MKNENLIRRIERMLNDNPDDAKGHFELGVLYSENEDYRRAISELEKSLLLWPDNMKGHLELGMIYSKSGHYEFATRQWSLMTDNDGDLHLDHTKSLPPQKIAGVVTMWDRYRQSEPDGPYKFFTLGFANLILGRWDRAILDFKAAIKDNKNLKNVNFYKGLCHFQKREYQMAINDFNNELSVHPRSPQCMYHLGLAYLETSRLTQAIGEFQKAIKEQPRYLKANYNLGCVYFNQFNYDRALETFNTVLGLNPNHIESYVKLGLVFEKKYMMDEATQQYQKALEINPNSKLPNFYLGLLYKNLGRLDNSLIYLKKAATADPGDGEINYYMGLIYIQNHDYNNAITKMRETLKNVPNHPFARYSLGLAYFKMNLMEEAIEHFEKALLLNDRDTQALNALGMAYLKSNKLEDSERCFNRTLEINPRECYAQYCVGCIKFLKEDYEGAILAFQKTAIVNGSSLHLRFLTGAQMIRQKNFERAMDELFNVALDTPMEEADLSVFATLQLLAITALEQSKKGSESLSGSGSPEALILLLCEVLNEFIPDFTNHAKRVAKAAVIIAKEIGLPGDEINKIRTAGLLHEIGKAKLDKRLLMVPPESLSEPDRRKVSAHPEFAYQYLTKIPGLEDVAKILRYQWQHFNGNGYPGDLKGKDIPTASQALLLANYWDDLIQRRKISPNDALDEILSQRFKMFNSNIVNAFLKVVDELLLIV